MSQQGFFLINNILKSDPDQGFTLVLTFSRAWCVKPFFENLDKQKFDRSNCHLLLYDNTDNCLLKEILKDALEQRRESFKSVRLYKSFRQGGKQLFTEENGKFEESKIIPIWEMQKDIINFITTDHFVQIEDDTLPISPHTISKLLKLVSKKDVGVATAVETGRSPILKPVGVGVHQLVKRKGDKILKRVSFPPNTKGIKKAQATGFYCFAAKSEVWENALLNMPTDISKIPRWGLDTLLTNNVVKLGYTLLADFSLWCYHMQLIAGKIFKYSKKHAYQDVYEWDPQARKYNYRQIKR